MKLGAGVQPLTFHPKAASSPDPQSPIPDPRSLPTYIYDADTPRVMTTPKHFAYVKIAEGCDYTCAFCIIPTLRGEYRSRTRESIVKEARALAERGVKELLLISQDTTFYGIDRQERGALATLLRELNEVDGLEWIRMLYCIRPRSPTTSSRRWQSATRSASTSTCRSSTRRPTSSSGCAAPETARPTTNCWPGSATGFRASH
jgi:hypothetical protein